MTIVTVSNLQKTYGTNEVLKGLDFQARAGEVIGVIGKNGAGKSTFLEILMTIRNYDNGNVTVFNENLKSLSTNQLEHIRKQISVVLQPTQFYKTLKVGELLKLFKAYYKSPIDIEKIIRISNWNHIVKSISISCQVVGNKLSVWQSPFYHNQNC